MKRWVALGAIAPLLALAQPAAAFEPIEGVWQTTTSIFGEFNIQQSGPNRFGIYTIKGDAPGSPCRVDENNFIRPVVREGRDDFLSGSGLMYTGRGNLWSVDAFLGTCTRLGDVPAQADVLSTDPTNYRARYCVRGRLDEAPLFDPSGQPAAGTLCTIYVRVREPLPQVERAAQVLRLPRLRTSGRTCRRTSRVATLRIANPVNEPLISLTVRVGRRVVEQLGYPVTASRLRLRLPRGRFTLTVAFETATRSELSTSRRYRACSGRRG
jgi:hypothetical protein